MEKGGRSLDLLGGVAPQERKLSHPHGGRLTTCHEEGPVGG
jgi:hypothetical protein